AEARHHLLRVSPPEPQLRAISVFRGRDAAGLFDRDRGHAAALAGLGCAAERVLEVRPVMKDAVYARKLGLARQRLRYGDTRGATEALKQALGANPQASEAHALLALVLLGQKRLHAAAFEAREALALQPESAFAHHALGSVLLAQRRFAKAREHLEQAILFEPNNDAHHLALARLFHVAGQREQEQSALRRALELSPDDADNLCAMGDFHRRSGDFERAEQLARAALEQEPEHADSLVLMGYIHLKRCEIEAAREHAIWALRHQPSDPDALVLMTAIKARQSALWGLWWRVNTWLGQLGDGRMVLVLLGAFVLQRLGRLAAADHDLPMTAELISVAWLAICVYSWVGPGMFQRSVRKELEPVSLGNDF